jgi:hypothetical protein
MVSAFARLPIYFNPCAYTSTSFAIIPDLQGHAVDGDNPHGQQDQVCQATRSNSLNWFCAKILSVVLDQN